MTIPKPMVRTVLERDGFRCMIAGPNCLREATVADHRAPRGMGGSKALNRPECLIAACGLCNGDRESASGMWRLDLESRGVIVPKDSTNAKTISRCAATPVRDPWGDLWFLLADGSRQLSGDPGF